MLLKIFNLRLDLDTMQFDDSILKQFSSEHDVISMKTQFFFCREEPIWSVIVGYRNQHRPSAVEQAIGPSTTIFTEIMKKSPYQPKFSNPFHREVYESLRVWRNETARQIGHPPSNLLNNYQLEGIVNLFPTSIKQLTKITGIGKYKASTYGHEILAILQQHQQHNTASFPSDNTSGQQIEAVNPTDDPEKISVIQTSSSADVQPSDSGLDKTTGDSHE